MRSPAARISPHSRHQVMRLMLSLCLAGALQGCVTPHLDPQTPSLTEALDERGIVVPVQDTAAMAPPAGPLSVAGAVRLALSNSAAVRNEYAELAIGAGALNDTRPWPNPIFSGEWLDPKFAGNTQRVFGLAVSVGDLIRWPRQRQIARQHYAALQWRVADAVIGVAGGAAAAFYDYAAALQSHKVQERATETAVLRADLGGRFREAGNLNAREIAELRSHAAAARLAVLDSAGEVERSRVALANMLGLSARAAWQIDSRLALPDSRDAVHDVDELVGLALATRLDLEAARAEVEARRMQHDEPFWIRWFEEMEIGYIRDRDSDGGLKRGAGLAWQLPLFDHGAQPHHHDLMIADPALYQAQVEHARMQLEIENAVHLAAGVVRIGDERVSVYADQLLPSLSGVTQGALAEYNFMLTGAFDLLGQKQEQLESYAGYVGALRDYWIARAALDRVLGTAPVLEPDKARWFDVAEALQPPQGGHEGMHHGDHGSPKPGGDGAGNGAHTPGTNKSPQHSGHEARRAEDDHSGHDGHSQHDRDARPRDQGSRDGGHDHGAHTGAEPAAAEQPAGTAERGHDHGAHMRGEQPEGAEQPAGNDEHAGHAAHDNHGEQP